MAYNCEMSVDKDIINYLTVNDISTNLSNKSLAIKDAIYSIAKKINHNAITTDEKIENIVQYVIDTITYNEKCTTDDNLLLETNNNALENALNGTGVCKSYTALTTALMRAENIYAYEKLFLSLRVYLLEYIGIDFDEDALIDAVKKIELLSKKLLLQKLPSLTRTNFDDFIKNKNLTYIPKMEVVSHNLLVNLRNKFLLI